MSATDDTGKARRMIRLSHQQDRYLKKEAVRLGISVSDLIRRLLDKTLGFDGKGVA